MFTLCLCDGTAQMARVDLARRHAGPARSLALRAERRRERFKDLARGGSLLKGRGKSLCKDCFVVIPPYGVGCDGEDV